MLRSSTHPRWFESSRAGQELAALLSDHLHCERKAAENALALVRRYPGDADLVERLSRLAHEETSHLVQCAALLAERGLALKADTPNHYARLLLAEVRPRDPERRVDALLVAALIEARSHERLTLLARGFARVGDRPLADFYRALGNAEERHAETYVDLAAATAGADEARRRLDELALREAEILASLPHLPRVH